MAAAEPGRVAPGTVKETSILLSYLRELGPGAIVSLEVRFRVRPPPRRAPRRRRRPRYREERLERVPDGGGGLVAWVPFWDHGYQTTPSTSPLARGAPGLIRLLERSKGGTSAFFDRLIAGSPESGGRGYDDLDQAHRFRVYVLGYEGEPGVWPAT